MRLGNIFLGAPANILTFGLGAQPGIVMLGGQRFQLANCSSTLGRVSCVLAGRRCRNLLTAGSLLGSGSWVFSGMVMRGSPKICWFWGRLSGFQGEAASIRAREAGDLRAGCMLR